MFCTFLVIRVAVLQITGKVKHVILSWINPILTLVMTPCTRSPTSVAWSVWSLMLMNVCSSLSRPSLAEKCNVPWFCRTLGLAEPCGPHKPSSFVSLPLESSRAASGRLRAPLERMLGRKRMHGSIYKQCSTSLVWDVVSPWKGILLFSAVSQIVLTEHG